MFIANNFLQPFCVTTTFDTRFPKLCLHNFPDERPSFSRTVRLFQLAPIWMPLNFSNNWGPLLRFDTPFFKSIACSSMGLLSPTTSSSYYLECVLPDAQSEIGFYPCDFLRVHMHGTSIFPTFGCQSQCCFSWICHFISNATEAFFFKAWSQKVRNRNVLDFWEFFYKDADPQRNALYLALHEPTGYFFQAASTGTHFGGSHLSERTMHAIWESQLQRLHLSDQGFDSTDGFAQYLYSLQSTALESLALFGHIPLPAMAVAIQQCPALIHFSMSNVWLGREDWECLLNAFCNHKMLSSLTLNNVHWRDITYEEAAVSLTTMLKENTNIEKLKTESFFMNQRRDNTTLETKILLQVGHNYYSIWFLLLHQMEAASICAGLVAAAPQ